METALISGIGTGLGLGIAAIILLVIASLVGSPLVSKAVGA
jgi:hypothetical protein